MKNVLIALFLASLALPLAAAPCPSVSATSIPECANFGPGGCPTQAECDRGWQWASPNAGVRTLPIRSNSDGSYDICYFDPPPGGRWPDCNSIYPALPPPPPPPQFQTAPLRQYCFILRGLNPPVSMSAWVGMCGTDLSTLAPETVRDTAAAVLAWQHVGPGKLSRIKRMAGWVLEGGE